MILVISRFKVANRLEENVRKAFRKRPHLVETVPGFLGLEVFTDHSDPSIFYLYTRWTDRETFDAWHKSPAHHLSHAILPKGLKLDPTFTQVLKLDRLPQKELNQATFQNILFDSTLLLESFLTQTNSVFYCAIDPSGRFKIYNDVVLSVLKTSKTELNDKTFWDFLTVSDKQNLRNILKTISQISKEQVRLNLVDSSNMPHTFDFLIQQYPSHAFTLIGEEPQDFNQNSFEELMSIQNEMTVMRREELKSTKRLLEQNWSLDQIVKERTKEIQSHQEKLRAILVELTLVEQRERQKIANDLHDFLAQLLAACTIELSQIDKCVISAHDQNIVEKVDEHLNQALTFTRTLIADLHPTILQYKGLLAAIEWLARDMQGFGLVVSTPADIPSVNISDDMGILIYKTVRELLFNVLKHSGVKTASLNWECLSDHKLLIQIKDSGKGFDSGTKMHEQAPGHLGLFFYRERIEAIRGEFDISSSPGLGTTVTIKVILERKDDL